MNISLRQTIQTVFGNDSLDWIDRSCLVDWTIIGSIWLLSKAASNVPVYEREFSHKDQSIKHHHRHHSHIGSGLNHFIAFILPITFITIIGIKRKSFIFVHHGISATCAALGFSRLVTELLKNLVGRLRPDFLSRCKWDKELEQCTGYNICPL